MQRSSFMIALVSALVVLSAGVGGALALSTSTHPQESTTGTTVGGTSETTGIGTETTATTGGGMTTGATGQSGPSITFNDQNTSGDSVLIQSATLPQNGFVVIYDSTRSGNETNQIIGESYVLDAGTSDNIRIQLDEPIKGTKSLTAIVHTDTNNNGQFDYISSSGKEDTPLMENGRRIVDIAEVSSSQQSNGGSTQAAAGGNETTQTATSANNATSGNESGGSGGSGAFGPGFGPVVAVVALLAVALLALRRQ